MYKIFLSHSYNDIKLARAIKNKCQDMGIDVYMCQDDPRPGYNLPQKLEANLKNSNAVIVLITSNSMNSDSVKQEIGVAVGANKWIIPFVERGIDPTKLVFLQGLEYIMFDPSDRVYGMKSISDYLGRVGRKFGSSQVAVTNESGSSVIGGLGALLIIILSGILLYNIIKS